MEDGPVSQNSKRSSISAQPDATYGFYRTLDEVAGNLSKSFEPSDPAKGVQAEDDSTISWSGVGADYFDHEYDLPHIDVDERIIRWDTATLAYGGFGFAGLLFLTDHRLLFGRKRPKPGKIAAKVQFSLSTLDIESIHREKWLCIFPRLRIRLSNGDEFTLRMMLKEAWIDDIVREHDRLYAEFEEQVTDQDV
jgi:hypothetical protein